MADTAVRLLIVMRHAKAESFAERDHARGLTSRGRQDSRSAGAWMSREELTPDLILVSSAKRAVATADEVCGGLGVLPHTKIRDELYAADEYDVLATCVAEIPDSAGCVLVIGHNPTMEGAAMFLQPEDDRTMVHFPTAGLAVLETALPWRDLEAGTCRLVETWVPKER